MVVEEKQEFFLVQVCTKMREGGAARFPVQYRSHHTSYEPKSSFARFPGHGGENINLNAVVVPQMHEYQESSLFSCIYEVSPASKSCHADLLKQGR